MDRSALVAMGLVLTVVTGGCAETAPTEDGLPATWALPPDEHIGPDTTEFTALVTERTCASGQSSEGRIASVGTDFSAGMVVVTFRVRPLPGDQECPGNPPTPVRVQLGQPLGDRRLLDGGREPPAEPPVCANPESCE